MVILKKLSLQQRLSILTNSAKYDVSCAWKDINRKEKLFREYSSYINYITTSDGKCIPVLKILMTNYCIYNCAYCLNRVKNDIRRTKLSPSEIAKITYILYKKNYVQGLFLSSGILKNPDCTMENIIFTAKILRELYNFRGYIHLKIIPGCDLQYIKEAMKYANRVSINIELPSEKSLKLLAPDKNRENILKPMKYVSYLLKSIPYLKTKSHTTQLIIGATPESDYQILNLSRYLYEKFSIKRVYYSAYVPVNEDSRLPSISNPPFKRENRLYQADWLIREYGFSAEEFFFEKEFLPENIDPKLLWAINNLDKFPIDVSLADYEVLIRIPGIGIKTAKKIVKLRRENFLSFDILKKIHVNLKIAKYFITVNGKSIVKEKEISYFLNSKLNKTENKLF